MPDISLLKPSSDLESGLYGATVIQTGEKLEINLVIKYGNLDTPITPKGTVLVYVYEKDQNGEFKVEVKESKFAGIEEGETFSWKE